MQHTTTGIQLNPFEGLEQRLEGNDKNEIWTEFFLALNSTISSPNRSFTELHIEIGPSLSEELSLFDRFIEPYAKYKHGNKKQVSIDVILGILRGLYTENTSDVIQHNELEYLTNGVYGMNVTLTHYDFQREIYSRHTILASGYGQMLLPYIHCNVFVVDEHKSDLNANFSRYLTPSDMDANTCAVVDTDARVIDYSELRKYAQLRHEFERFHPLNLRPNDNDFKSDMFYLMPVDVLFKPLMPEQPKKDTRNMAVGPC